MREFACRTVQAAISLDGFFAAKEARFVFALPARGVCGAICGNTYNGSLFRLGAECSRRCIERPARPSPELVRHERRSQQLSSFRDPGISDVSNRSREGLCLAATCWITLLGGRIGSCTDMDTGSIQQRSRRTDGWKRGAGSVAAHLVRATLQNDSQSKRVKLPLN